MRGIMKTIMKSCQLSFIENMQLKMHLKVCKTCKDYRNDSQILDEAIEILMARKKDTTIELTPEQKQKILDTLS